jgi:hypothetical protein
MYEPEHTPQDPRLFFRNPRNPIAAPYVTHPTGPIRSVGSMRTSSAHGRPLRFGCARSGRYTDPAGIWSRRENSRDDLGGLP